MEEIKYINNNEMIILCIGIAFKKEKEKVVLCMETSDQQFK